MPAARKRLTGAMPLRQPKVGAAVVQMAPVGAHVDVRLATARRRGRASGAARGGPRLVEVRRAEPPVRRRAYSFWKSVSGDGCASRSRCRRRASPSAVERGVGAASASWPARAGCASSAVAAVRFPEARTARAGRRAAPCCPGEGRARRRASSGGRRRDERLVVHVDEPVLVPHATSRTPHADVRGRLGGCIGGRPDELARARRRRPCRCWTVVTPESIISNAE